MYLGFFHEPGRVFLFWFFISLNFGIFNLFWLQVMQQRFLDWLNEEYALRPCRKMFHNATLWLIPDVLILVYEYNPFVFVCHNRTCPLYSLGDFGYCSVDCDLANQPRKQTIFVPGKSVFFSSSSSCTRKKQQ